MSRANLERAVQFITRHGQHPRRHPLSPARRAMQVFRASRLEHRRRDTSMREQLIRDAGFSPCRTWRYWLTRRWNDELPPCGFIGLNPSHADENEDDQTIRRCTSFAKQWGNGGIVMLNLFAIVESDPAKLSAVHVDLVGKDNDRWLRHF